MGKGRSTVDLNGQLETLDRERIQVKYQIDRQQLISMTDSVIEVMTSPAFIERMRRARALAAAGSGLDMMENLLTLKNLREDGAKIPDDFRLTSRVFEDDVGGFRIESTGELSPAERAVALVGCCGAGAASVCGCCGGCSIAVREVSTSNFERAEA